MYNGETNTKIGDRVLVQEIPVIIGVNLGVPWIL